MLGRTLTLSKSLARAVRILKVLTEPNNNGFSLTEISIRAEIPHPTAHRLLQQLITEGMVDQRSDKRYVLGHLIFELGLSAKAQFEFSSHYQPLISDLAHVTGETVYLTLRSGFDAVCMVRKDGTIQPRGLNVLIGSRRPLGVGVGGLAIISQLSNPIIEEILEINSKRLIIFRGMTKDDIWKAINETRERGYALISNRVVLGATAVGIPLFDVQGQVFGAVCIASINERMFESRHQAIAQLAFEKISHYQSSG